MSVDIHGKKVGLEPHSESVVKAAEYLQSLESSEARNIFEAAVHHGYAHFEMPRHSDWDDKNLHHDMTLEHRGGTYYLRRRG